MRMALVKAIALPAVYRANLECQLHVPFQHSRMRVIDSRMHGCQGFCTLVHSFGQCFCFHRNLLFLQMLMSVLCPYNSAILMLTVLTLRMVLFALARVAILEMEQIVLVC